MIEMLKYVGIIDKHELVYHSIIASVEILQQILQRFY